jgi:U3 small nucleolar RNA-associated protein 4
MSIIELHRARFVEWTPSSVVSLAATPDGAAVAVGREDGSVELYDVTQEWRCVAMAPGCESASLTALAWTAAAGGRLQLVSSSLNGQLVTWDFQALRPLSVVDSNGGPVWHIAAQPLRNRGVDEVQVRPQCLSDGSTSHHLQVTLHVLTLCPISNWRSPAMMGVCACSVRSSRLSLFVRLST